MNVDTVKGESAPLILRKFLRRAESIYLEVQTHVLPVADMTAVLFERAYAHTAHGRYRPAAEKSQIQHADGLSLAERIEHPIGHVKVHLPTTSVLSSPRVESRPRRLQMSFT